MTLTPQTLIQSKYCFFKAQHVEREGLTLRQDILKVRLVSATSHGLLLVHRHQSVQRHRPSISVSAFMITKTSLTARQRRSANE